MDWAQEASALVERVNAGIPAFVRGMVRRVVARESERLAAEAGADRVHPEHVRRAYRLRTPKAMQPLLRRALEAGATPAPAFGPGGPEVAAPTFPVGEPMSRSEIEEFLAWERTGRLGCVAPEGKPYVVPLSFVYEAGAVYYHWFSDEGRKVRNVTACPQVCFEADWASRDHLRYRSVIADGRIAELTDVPEKARILDLLADRFPEYATGAGHSEEVRGIIDTGRAAMAEAVRIFRIGIESMTGKKKGPPPY
jgi:uncharacterized protein